MRKTIVLVLVTTYKVTMTDVPDHLLNRLKRVLRHALESGNDEVISDFIVAQSQDEKTRSKLIVAALIELKSGHADVGRNVIRRIDIDYNKLPDDFCGEIVKEFSRDRYWDFALIRQAADITAQRLLKPNERILLATTEWLQSDYSETLLESIAKKNGRKAMENLIEKNPRIVCYLLHRPGEPRTNTLHLLKKVAKHSERSVEVTETLSDIFEDCVHSEGWGEIASQVFEIASILNPVDEPKEVICLDTSYLMNWCKQKKLFSSPVSMNIQDLVGELSSSITKSPALQCFDEILRLNRIVDLLMLLDQGIKRYRGHDIHQFNVAALGLFFLDTCVKDGRSLEEYLSEFYEEKLNEPLDIRKTWLLTSLLHDHALPIYHLFAITPHIYQRIRGRARTPGNRSAIRDDDYLKALKRLRNALELAYYDLISNNLARVYDAFKTDAGNKEETLKNLISKEMSRIGLDKFAENRIDHGVMGAANITSRFEGLLDRNVEVFTRAIGMHDMKKEPIGFKNDPMTFLLVVCDELQEWGREVAVFPEILMDIPSLKIGRFRIEDGKRFFTDNLNVSFRFLKGAKEQTRFDPTYFLAAKSEFFTTRLRFDAQDVFPQIGFDAKPAVSNLPCKADAGGRWAWSC